MTTTSLSREDDHLGLIRRTLNELTGYATMAFELIQNADDADGSTSMRFDVREDGLWVENDGVFTDCGDQTVRPDDCHFLKNNLHRCDFHSFRLNSGADKRNRDDTTGAMGIGFTSVYQITDRPELRSDVRHWVVDETKSQDERITETTLAEPFTGTRLVLPWAKDHASEFRTRVQVAPAPPDVEERIAEVLCEVVSTAILFLRRLDRIEILRNGVLQRMVTRAPEGGDLLIEDTGEVTEWRILEGEFEDDAAELRTRFGTQIEPKRRATVAIAVPVDRTTDGRLCATLPMETASGLPMHINAEFFVATDRRRPLMSAEFAEAWNRAAIRAAAVVIASHLEHLVGLVGPARLWEALEGAWKLTQDEGGDPVDGLGRVHWEHLKAAAAESAIVWTSKDELVTPNAVRLVRSTDELTALSVLEGIGLPMVNAELRRYSNVLASAGVAFLDVAHVAGALDALDLGEGTALEELRAPLDEPDARRELWAELGRLVNALPSDEQRALARETLADVPLVPTLDGSLASLRAAYFAEPDVGTVFARVMPGRPFVDLHALPAQARPLGDLGDWFTPEAAIDELGGVDHATQPTDGATIVSWFAADDGMLNDENRMKLASLPIFPASDGRCRPLTELALPGDFDDVLELAGQVTSDTANRHGLFLADLGARKLTFAVYVEDHVDRALARPDLPAAQRRQVAALLAENWSTVSDDPRVRACVVNLNVVECANGDWVSPGRAYRPSRVVRAILGDDAPVAKEPETHRHSANAFLLDLDVPDVPRRSDAIARMTEFSEGAVSVGAVNAIASMVDWLGERWRELDPAERTQWEALRSLPWLPLNGDDEWHVPSELDLAFQQAAFASQGAFVRLPLPLQQRATDVLRWLGLRDVPSTLQIVRHLRHCEEVDAEPSRLIYSLLNGRVDHPEIDQLIGTACLRIEGRWWRPSEAFWRPHAFGQWRVHLGDGFADSRALLQRIGVRDVPEPTDAIEVLLDIAETLGPTHDEISQEDQAIARAAWCACDDALRAGDVEEVQLHALRNATTAVDRRGVLVRPGVLFFEDLAGLAREFAALADHIVQRPDGAAAAMLTAGVRNLSRVAVARVVDLGDRHDSGFIEALLADREPALARLIASADTAPWRSVAARLAELSWVAVSRLTIGWELEQFGRIFSSEVKSAAALWVRDDNRVYVEAPDGDVASWEAVSREVLRAAWEDQPPVQLALSVTLVLQARSLAAAERSLDEAGIPRLATDVLATIEASTAQEFDTADDESGGATQDLGLEAPPHPDAEGKEPELAGSADDPDRGRIAGPGGDSEQAALDGSVASDGEDGGSRGEPREPRRQRSESRLRSYVITDRGEQPDDPPPDARDRSTDDRISAIDKAGVEAVVAYELRHGRLPEVMEHTNEGYDVLSAYEDGEPARWIEVKSTSGAWDLAGVALSPAQFRFAQRQVAEQWWLYVVEHALDDDSRRVWAIQDPVERISDYMFDDGWKGLSETASATVAPDTVPDK